MRSRQTANARTEKYLAAIVGDGVEGAGARRFIGIKADFRLALTFKLSVFAVGTEAIAHANES